MQDEYTTLIDNDTWELAPSLSRVNIVHFMWSFCHKTNYENSFAKYKAHLLGDGSFEWVDVDCLETLS